MITIHQAAEIGDIQSLKDCLAAEVDLEAYNASGYTPLMIACLSASASLEVVRFLLDAGANVNALTNPKDHTFRDADFDVIGKGMMDDEADEELKKILQHVKAIQQSTPHRQSVLAVAAGAASEEKLRLLLERGADPAFISNVGYSAILNAACTIQPVEILRLLIHAGAPLDHASAYGERAVKIYSRRACFEQVRLLLDHGADATALEWNDLHHAVVFGPLDDLALIVDQGLNREHIDHEKRTPFLLAVHAGKLEHAKLLLDHGANRHASGHCGRSAVHYAVMNDDLEMLRWLTELGFSLEQQDEFQASPLMVAVEESSVSCFDWLMECGADFKKKDEYGDSLLKKATAEPIIRRLIARGMDPSHLEKDMLRKWVGLDSGDELSVVKADYLAGRFRRYGNANPERMNLPFWNAMVRCGWEAYQATTQFDDCSFGRGNPVWCHHRFGMTTTALPDGRFIQIAGEHEDSYDPDFCIYNDVVMHDGKGGFEILGYPEEVFPPTDFHSATLFEDWIYIIGNLGYQKTHESFDGETPVFRFHCPTGKIERVTTSGLSPGWIHDHEATLDGSSIIVKGGKILSLSDEKKSRLEPFSSTFAIDLTTAVWCKL